MRNILFRAKRTGDGKFIHGFFETDKCTRNMSVDFIIDAGDFSRHIVYRNTLGQFTGIFDTKGLPVFEGDICTGAWDTIFVVFFDEDYLQFRGRSVDGGSPNRELDFYGLDKITIIGNIYDNPELLKGAKP